MTKEQILIAKEKAELAKMNFKHGFITLEEAKKTVKTYIDMVNTKSKEIAKKYNQKPKLVTVASFMR